MQKTTEDLSTLEGIYVAGMIEITQKIKDLTKEQLGSGDERVAQIQKEIKEYEKLHQGIMNMLLLVQRVQKEREDDMEKFRSEIQSIGEGYEKICHIF